MKKYALVFLSVFLFISAPFAAHANIVTATGKYLINAVKHVPGAVRVDATNTATGAKHVIKHGISSADLGKGIGAGIVGMAVGSGVGLAFQAITELALDAVDWVMDKENNRVKYRENIDPNIQKYIWGNGTGDGQIFANATDAANFRCKSLGMTFYSFYDSGFSNNQGINCRDNGGNLHKSAVVSILNPDYVESPIEKYLPLETLAAKVIKQADDGSTAAQIDIEIYVTHIAQNGDLDIELDNATDITEPENPDEPNPEEPEQCPSGTVKVDDVCVKIPDSDSDEPLFCDSSKFTKKVCDWIDWTQKPHDKPDSGNVDIKDKSEDLSIDNNRIDFSNQCPSPTPINTSVGGFPVSTELNYQPLCDFFTMLNPFVIGMGGISSALIIAGGARRG